ncbi:hypothetical protein N8737_03340 [Verrucomicrobia bacterium]|nr:hypothetical protein [Verrucomicrobiota bacterium]
MKNLIRTTLAIATGLFCAAQQANATPANGAFLQGNLVGDASPTLATGTPTSVFWNQGAATDPTVFDFSLSDATKLIVKIPGDYFIAATIPLTDASARATIAAELYINGEVVPGTRSESSYMRNSNGHDESSDHIAQLVPGLNAGDVIELKLSKTTKATDPATINSASMYVELVDSSRTVFSALSDGPDDGDDNLNRDFDVEDPALLTWASNRKDAGFTHTDGGEEITLGSGSYLVTANVPLSGAIARGGPGMLITLNGDQVPGGRAEQGYIRNADSHTAASLHFSGVIEVSGNQRLRIETWKKGNPGNITLPEGKQASLFIEKLGDSGVFSASATETVDGIDFNPDVATQIAWKSPSIIDSALYSSNTSSGAVTVKEAGNYLLVYNDALESSIQRAAPKITVEVNGNPVAGAMASTQYIRSLNGHNSASASIVFLLDSLSANDDITVSTVREAQAGEVLADFDPALLSLIKKPNFVPDPSNGLAPRLSTFSAEFSGFNVGLEEVGLGINDDSVKVSVDGAAITPSITRTGNKIEIRHDFDFFPKPGQTFSVELDYNDTASPAGAHSESVEVTVPANFGFLSSEFKVDNVDTSMPGFIANITQISEVQIDVATAFAHGNNSTGAERQLRGEFIDPNTEAPYLNEAGDFDATSFEITPVNVDLVNFEQAEGSIGNFTEATGFKDALFPGIPGFNESTDGVAGEFLTHVELKRGFNTMGVNSDDGFKVTSGPSPVDQFGTRLGIFDSDRGSADTIFNFVVEEDGVYPMRLLWWEGRGGANVEWFSVVEGEKILVNDTSNANANKAYRKTTNGAITYASKVTPSPGATGVEPDTSIEVQLTDGSEPVDTATVSLTVNGANVDASVSKSDGVTTVSFAPDGFLAGGSTQTASLSYNGITRDWSFTVRDYGGPTLDRVGSYPGLILGNAEYTADGGGVSGEAGDYGMDFTAQGGSVVVTQFEYLKDAFANDELTVAFWSKKHAISNSSAFWITSASANNGNRGFQAHVPWGNNQIYLDTQGCCTVPTQRLNGSITEFPDYSDDTFWTDDWHFYSFSKKDDFKEIRIDGELFLDIFDSDPLISDVTGLFIGSDGGLGNNDLSVFDDFAVFSTALSESDLKSIVGGTSPSDLPSSKGLLAHWDFNDAGSVTPVEPPVVVPPVVLPPVVLPPIPGGGVAGAISGIENNGGTIVINFTGTLMSSDTLTGDFGPVEGATSPFSTTAEGSATFYIAR